MPVTQARIENSNYLKEYAREKKHQVGKPLKRFRKVFF